MFAMYKDALHPAAQRGAETRLTILYRGIQASIRRAFMLQRKQSKVRGRHSAIHPDIGVTIDLVSKICSRPRGQHGCLYSPLRDPDCMQNKNGAFESHQHGRILGPCRNNPLVTDIWISGLICLPCARLARLRSGVKHEQRTSHKRIKWKLIREYGSKSKLQSTGHAREQR